MPGRKGEISEIKADANVRTYSNMAGRFVREWASARMGATHKCPLSPFMSRNISLVPITRVKGGRTQSPLHFGTLNW